jgi:hypothetical protein
LYGFENIAANNGWGMAAVGASIVFLGLVVLSFVISQIHKILRLWEERDKFFNRFGKQVPVTGEEKSKSPVYKISRLPAVTELASIYRPLAEPLGERFELSRLHEISKKMNLPHPHLSIKYLVDADILIAQGDGTFSWNKQKGY